MGLRDRLQAAVTVASGDRIGRHRAATAPYIDRLPTVRPALPSGGYAIGPLEHWMLAPQRQPWFESWADAPASDRISLGIVLLEHVANKPASAFDALAAPAMLSGLARSLPLHDRSDRQLVVRLARRAIANHRSQPAAAYAAAVLERSINAGEPIEQVEAEIGGLIDEISAGGFPTSDLGPLRARLLRLVGAHADERQLFDDGDTWGAAMQKALRSNPEAPALRALLRHLSSATTVSPSRRWNTEAGGLLRTDVSEELIHGMVDLSFDARLTRGPNMHILDAGPFQPGNVSLVRGAYWAAAVGRWPWVAETLGRAGLHWALSGRNDNYARDQRLANTTAALLADIATPDSLASLGRIHAKVRNRSVAKTVAAALDRAAAAAGTSPSELLELAVPRLGFDTDSRRTIPVGSGAAILEISDDGNAQMTWRDPGGRVSQSVPKFLTEQDKVGVAAAKAELKELRKALNVERARIEDLLVEDREWAYATWAGRYLEHPLSRSFARRLIWRFGSADAWTSGLPLAGGVAAADGSTIAVETATSVRLWHPIDASADEVGAWRRLLLERQLGQPFKQAFREVYLLAPAEEESRTYSNRFAAHVLNYPVARALMGARRWGTNFLGPFDGGFEGTAKREFRSRGFRAEFYHDAIEAPGEQDGQWGGAVEFCSTDQVRFYPLPARGSEPLPLVDIAPVVFSETMRDVDLFVSVSSIAADENWQDGGRGRTARFGEYWQATAFGELGPTAESRRQVLAWMLPQLAIHDRVALEERYLRVRGDLRTYRIHLGSGNVVMEPNDQYLCIVPGRGDGASSRVFLPFDDDHRLAVILSKAQLLANDRAITDSSIVRQIIGSGRV